MKYLYIILILLLPLITTAKLNTTNIQVSVNSNTKIGVSYILQETWELYGKSPIISKGYIGLELTEYQNPSIILGGDFIIGDNGFNPMFGFSMNWGGYNDIHKRFLPNWKIGVDYNSQVQLYLNVNWKNTSFSNRYFTYYKPKAGFNVGLTYRFL